MNVPSLKQLFMKIDANSDGTLSWDEFSGYILEKGETLDANAQKQAAAPAQCTVLVVFSMLFSQLTEPPIQR